MIHGKGIRGVAARAAVLAVVFTVFALMTPQWTRGMETGFIAYGQSGGTPPITITTVTKVIPQIAVGSFDGNASRYKTVIQIVNEGSTPATISGHFYNEDGTASSLVLKTNISTIPTITGSFANVSLPSNGVMVITADAVPSFAVNWAKIVSTGGTVSTSAYFDLTNGAGTQLLSRVGVPPSEPGMSKFTIPRVRNVEAGLDVGFALVNTGTASATIDATLRSATGAALGKKSLTLAAGAHVAAFTREFFELSGEAAGTNYSFVSFESMAAQFAATALAIEGGSLSSFPISIPGSGAVSAVGEPADGSVTTLKLSNAAVTTDKIADNAITSVKVAAGQVVKSINSLKDAVTLTAGSNVTITASGNTLTIGASGSQGGGGAAAATIFTYAGAVQPWTVPSGVTYLEVEAWGGGAGGGGGSAGHAEFHPGNVIQTVLDQYVYRNGLAGKGGAGGSYSRRLIPVPAGAVQLNITVGGGGGGGKGGITCSPACVSAGTGSAGGATFVEFAGSQLVVAGGGQGSIPSGTAGIVIIVPTTSCDPASYFGGSSGSGGGEVGCASRTGAGASGAGYFGGTGGAGGANGSFAARTIGGDGSVGSSIGGGGGGGGGGFGDNISVRTSSQLSPTGASNGGNGGNGAPGLLRITAFYR